VPAVLEHTLIQPFVGEKFDSHVFSKAFGQIEKNPALTLPERRLDVIIPVHAIPKGYDWDEIGDGLLSSLTTNHVGLPSKGESSYIVTIGSKSKNSALSLTITLRTMHLPGVAGSCRISRGEMPGDLGTVVDKALRTKIPKLVRTTADKRILLLERDHVVHSEGQVYGEIVRLAPIYPELARVDEIWFADTACAGWTWFRLIDGRGLVEQLTFEGVILRERRDDRPDLGPPRREF